MLQICLTLHNILEGGLVAVLAGMKTSKEILVPLPLALELLIQGNPRNEKLSRSLSLVKAKAGFLEPSGGELV